MAEQPWYKDGLRFKCTQCGDCCTGAPGYVWVNQAEIEGIAAELGESDVEAFEDEYVQKGWHSTQPPRVSQRRLRFLRYRKSKMHGVQRPPAPMPHLAILGLECQISRGLG